MAFQEGVLCVNPGMEESQSSVIDSEQLISLVFQRPALWDKRIKSHGNRYVLLKHWKEIATIMSVEEAKLKKKWKYLRDQFSIELAKKKPPRSGDAAGETNFTKWPYFKLLLFLTDVVKPRPSSGNLTLSEHPSNANHAESSQQVISHCNTEDMAPTSNNEMCASEDECDITATNTTANTEPAAILQPSSDEHRRVTGKRTNRTSLNESLLDIERKKLDILTENAKRRRVAETCEDEDLLFFKSLLPHIKKIPDNKKLSFRSKIQEVVQSFAYTSSPHSVSSNSSTPVTWSTDSPVYPHEANNSITETISE